MSPEGIQRPDSTRDDYGHSSGPGGLRRIEGEQIRVGENVRHAISGLLFRGRVFCPTTHTVLSELLALVESASIEELHNSGTYGLCVPNSVGQSGVGKLDRNLDLRPQEIRRGDNSEGLKIGLRNVIAHSGRMSEMAVRVWSDLPGDIRQFVGKTLGSKRPDQVTEVLRLAAKLHDVGKFLLSSTTQRTLQLFYTGQKFDGPNSGNILQRFLLGHVIEGAEVLIGDKKDISLQEQLVCVSAALLHHLIDHQQPYPQFDDIQRHFQGIKVSVSGVRINDFVSFVRQVCGFIQEFKTTPEGPLKPDLQTDNFLATVGRLRGDYTNNLALTCAIFSLIINAVDIYDARLFDARNYHGQRPSLDTVLQGIRQAQMPEVICQILHNVYSDFSSKFGSGTSSR